MNIAVIGTVNRDTIYPYTGPRIESYGGILYNLFVLAALIPQDITLFPICNLGEDVHKPVLREMAQFRNIETQGIHIVAQKNNHAILRYTSPNTRVEYLENIRPWRFTPYTRDAHAVIELRSGFLKKGLIGIGDRIIFD